MKESMKMFEWILSKKSTKTKNFVWRNTRLISGPIHDLSSLQIWVNFGGSWIKGSPNARKWAANYQTGQSKRIKINVLRSIVNLKDLPLLSHLTAHFGSDLFHQYQFLRKVDCHS